MKSSFDEILEDCLRRLEASGESIGDALARYPEWADELRPHLELWSSLSGLEKEEAAAQAVNLTRQRLLTAIGESERKKGGERSMGSIGVPGLRFLAVFAAGAALALGITFLTGSLDFGGGSTAQADPFQDCVLQLDFNDDGVLDVGDVEAFRNAIDTQDPNFDLDGDGDVDVFDAVAAVNAVVECLRQLQPPAP